ncbi:putative reverse transcriptase domain-containing protein [Tanacetum coccineum]
MEVVLDEEEVANDFIPLATKPPTITDWMIHQEGKKSYYQIIRADGKSQIYRVFSQMLKSFSKEDLEDLYKLVKAKYGLTRPVEDLDLILWGDLKTMFKPHVEDQVWKNQDNYSVLDLKLYDPYMLNKKLQGRIVRIKRLLDDLRLIAAKLMLLVYKLLLLVLKVNAASTKVRTAQRLRLLKEFLLIMPPRRFKKKSVKRIVEKRVAKAIEEYEKTRTDSNNAGGSGSANTGGTVAPEMHGCSYKTFTNGKPHSFNGTEGVVGLKRWFEKMEQVFEICKCAEDDKVKFAMCTFEGRALTWWNGNVQTLGLANANQIPWSNVKAMMTTEYCPATEIQRMEQELWTLTLKGDDIEAYNNRFHELVLMCPELVSTEKKKIEKYIRGFPEGIKGNVTSSKPATLHDAINMARELIEQGVQAKALRIGDSNKRKWEDQQGNNYHQQQNRRQEAAKVYVAAPAKGRGYAGNLPWCNRCKAHHQPGPCPPRCGKCHKLGHQEGECRTRIPVARDNSLQNVTCFGCGNHGHYRSDCPELKNRN